MPRRNPEFLNVDLDLESREPLRRLAEALPLLIVMSSTRMRGKYVMSLEGAWPTLPLDGTLRRLAKMISSLSGDARRLWQQASKRSFNIGVACGSRCAPPFSISSTMVEAIAALGGSVEVTLYPYSENRPSAQHVEAQAQGRMSSQSKGTDRDARLIRFGQLLEAAIRGPARLLSGRRPRRFLYELEPRVQRIALQYPEFVHHLDREWHFFESTVAEREGDWPRVERLERRLLRAWPRSDGFDRSVRYLLLVDAQLNQGKSAKAATTAIRALSEPGDAISHEIILDHVTRRLADATGFIIKAARTVLGKRTRLPSSPQLVHGVLRAHLDRMKKRQVAGATTPRKRWRPPR